MSLRLSEHYYGRIQDPKIKMHFRIKIVCLAIVLLLACMSLAAPTTEHQSKARAASDFLLEAGGETHSHSRLSFMAHCPTSTDTGYESQASSWLVALTC